MKLQFRHKRWFYKHLFSYILLLVVPLVIINGCFGKQINETYQQEVVSRLRSDIHALRDTVDDELELLLSTVHQFQLLQTVNRYRFEDDPLQANSIKSMLATFTITNRLLGDIVYLPYGQNFLFTSSTTSRIDFFAREMYVTEGLEPEEFLSELYSLKHLKAYSVERYKNEKGLVIAIPLVSDYATVSGVCLFFIADSTLEAMIHSKLSQYRARLQLHADDDSLLFQSSASDEPMPDQAITFSVSSNVAPWAYTVHIPQEQALLDDLNRLSGLQQTSTLIVVLAVSVLIFFLMFINYTPIKRLQKLAGNLADANPAARKLGELEEIASTLDYLKNQNTSLVMKLEKSRESEHNIVLQRLLSGRYKTIKAFNVDASELSIEFQYPQFLVACIQLQETNRDSDELAQLMRDELPEELNCYYVFTPIPDRIYFINSVRTEDFVCIPAFYEGMRKTIEAQTGLSLTVGLGSLVEGAIDIPRSFLEARTALDYRFVKGKNTTIIFDEVCKSVSYSVSYPHTLLDQLHVSLKARNEEAIESRTAELIAFLVQDTIPLFLAKSISFDMITLFFDHLPASVQSAEDSQREFFLLSDIDTIDEVVQIVESVKDKLLHMEKLEHTEDSQALLKDITEYIKVHCFECNFTMLQVSDAFSMQLPNLSLFFKEHTQLNLLDYVTALRMHAAKQLLSETDLPLKDVSLQIGYYNISSFIRRFKQLNGITPGTIARYIRGCKENQRVRMRILYRSFFV